MVIRARSLVGSLRPLTDQWRQVDGYSPLAELLEEDHLEPEQLPVGFMDKLSKSDKDIESAVEQARLLENL